MKSARYLTVEVLNRITEDGAYSNLALRQALGSQPDMKPQEKNLTTELVYGVIKRLLTLDYYLQKLVQGKYQKLTPSIKNILRMSAYQIIYLERIPVSAAVNEAVKLAKRFGHEGTAKLVNAVLRRFAREWQEVSLPKEEDFLAYASVKYSHPVWLIAKWEEEFGKKITEELCLANNEVPKLCLRVNTLKTTENELLDKLNELGWQITKSPLVKNVFVATGVSNLEQEESFLAGKYAVQNEASVLVCEVLAPEKGAKVLDMCAAPGGKTMHMAEMMENKGSILALDIYDHKLALITDNAERLGAEIVSCKKQDATKPLQQSFDYVLLDAPCSGLGVLAHKADARWSKEAENIEHLVELQKELLAAAAKNVLSGGHLVYSLCTITKEEGQEQWLRFLQAHPEFEPEDFTEELQLELSLDERKTIKKAGYLQILPQRWDTDGFFIGKARKTKN